VRIIFLAIAFAAVLTVALWLFAPAPPPPAPPDRPITSIDLQPPLPDDDEFTAFSIPPESRDGSACYLTYGSFYEAPVVRIRVAFGYKDARPARFVGDRYEKIMLVSYLTRGCPAGFFACGFERAEDDADRFTRTITLPDGRTRQVELVLTHSSAGPDDDLNRRDRHQSWLSLYSRENMEEGLRQAQAVLYNGHSRDGGGPDFEPPRLRADDNHVDYYWYTQNRPGLRWLMSHLDETNPNPKLLGLFSCVSTNLFSKDVRKVKPKMGLVSNRQLLYYTDAMKGLMGTLSSILGLTCETGFDSAISAESTGGSSVLQGFFRND